MVREASREAVLALLQSIVAPDNSGVKDKDCGALDAGPLIQIASTQYVLPLMFLGLQRNLGVRAQLPDDAILFLQEIWKANEARNAKMRAELALIGALFARHDVRGIVLKGGCELIQPSRPEAGSRFLSDLDLLVAESHLGKARAVLCEQGYLEDDAPILFGDHHHLPALMHPGREISVELHSRIGSGIADQILPATELLSDSGSSNCPGILVPSWRHRLAHLVAHAQLNNKGYRDTTFTLRDLVDFHGISTKMSAAELTGVRERFQGVGCAELFDGMASAARILGPVALAETSVGRQWAERAMENFEQGRKRRAHYLLQRLRALVSDSGLRRQLSYQVLHPGTVAKLYVLHRDRMRRIH